MIVLPRKFRFQLLSKRHPGVEKFVTKVELDMKSSTLKIRIIEQKEVFELIENLTKHPGDVLTLVCYDGSGNHISEKTFSGLKTLFHSSKYNYKSSREVSHKIVVQFDQVQFNDSFTPPPS